MRLRVPRVSPDDVRSYLDEQEVEYDEKAIPYGKQFRCEDGEIVSVYDSGKLVIQGQPSLLTDELKEQFATKTKGRVAKPEEPIPSLKLRQKKLDEVEVTPDVSKQVFIVYGHDDAAREGLELLLHRMGLVPIVFSNLAAGGDTIIEKLESFIGTDGKVGFACVLLTPDDEGHATGEPENIQYRARQNVIMEMGMVLARLGRKRVAIIHKQSVELPSDIHGLLYLAYQERIDEVKTKLFRELDNAGLEPAKSSI